MTPVPLSLYIHFPWCIHKCPYCDFNSHTASNTLPEEEYIQSLIRDLEQELPHIWGRRLHTIFIGGGTPSLISPEGMQKLLTHIQKLLPVRPNMEITMEANPGTFEQERFAGYLDAGISRLSLGVQSFNPQHLKSLERIHDHNEAHAAFNTSQAVGFNNINLDLMFGLPEQSIEEALQDLQQAIDHQPQHISWYELTLEPNTLFHHSPPALPDPDTVAEMQEQGLALLKKAGYARYEVSAYAKTGKQCQHNLNYWEFGDYIGIGAGAHGKYTQDGNVTRYAKVKHPRDYMEAAQNNQARSTSSTLNDQDKLFEFMLNALRLKEGVAKTLLYERTNLDEAFVEPQLASIQEKGLLAMSNDHIVTTEQGWTYLNQTIEEFLRNL